MSEVIRIIKPISEAEYLAEEKSEESKAIVLQERLLRLMDNPDFKELILNEYMDRYLRKLSIQQSSLAISPEYKEHALDGIKAVGLLAKFLEEVDQTGRNIKVKRLRNYQDDLELGE